MTKMSQRKKKIEIDGKAHCILCHVVISSVKSWNIERHYKIHYAKYDLYLFNMQIVMSYIWLMLSSYVDTCFVHLLLVLTWTHGVGCSTNWLKIIFCIFCLQ